MRTVGTGSAALLALSLILSSGTGCAGHATPPKAPGPSASTMPATVTDADFGARLHVVLRGGTTLPRGEDLAGLRLGVVKQALTHASARFARGSDERAMMS